MKVLLASNNADKLREVRAIFGAEFEVVSPAEIGITLEVIEDGATFEDNARKKAVEFSIASKMLAIADDSGLEADSLGGKPGVQSARYAGPEQDYQKNCLKLLAAMKGVPREKRTARFKCFVAAAQGDKVIFVTDGSVEGVITEEMRGSGGFGYDPVFLYPPYKKTFAECAADEKNAVSHRGTAFKTARLLLGNLISARIHDDDTSLK
jgi:XTP/dITP diphosphohydrolase